MIWGAMVGAGLGLVFSQVFTPDPWPVVFVAGVLLAVFGVMGLVEREEG